MKNTFRFTLLAFLAGLGIGLFARTPSLVAFEKQDTRPADLVAIHKLHAQDVAVTLTQEPKGLVEIWSEDGVRIGPDNNATVGKSAIGAENDKFHAQYPEMKVAKYETAIPDANIAIVDDWALEVGETDAEFRLNAKDEPIKLHEKGMRLLKRQPDGSWKFALVGMR